MTPYTIVCTAIIVLIASALGIMAGHVEAVRMMAGG